jgi:hypothetical protein
MKFGRLMVAVLGVGLAAFGSQARADDPQSLGKFDDWEAFTYQSNGAPVCYVFSSPKDTQSDKKIAKRDPVYFLVSHFPGRKIKGQISTIIGYPFKESSTVTLQVDETNFELYTNGDTAWAAANETEAQIVKAMKTGKSLSIIGTSWKGTETTDIYSLAGINKALEKIDAACK